MLIKCSYAVLWSAIPIFFGSCKPSSTHDSPPESRSASATPASVDTPGSIPTELPQPVPAPAPRAVERSETPQNLEREFLANTDPEKRAEIAGQIGDGNPETAAATL